MAVYTDVSAEDLTDFLRDYDLGELLSYKGIAEGVENSNFLVHTTAGNFILTLYEKRVAPEDLSFSGDKLTSVAANEENSDREQSLGIADNKSGTQLRFVRPRPT